MTDMIADAISQGVDLLVSAVILTAIVSMLSTASAVSAKVNEQQAMNQQLVEWRKHNQFNGTEVYAQDVMSAILSNRGNPYVQVKFQDGTTKTWSLTNNLTDYTYTAVANELPASYVYRGSLKVEGGVVIGYEFQAHEP